MRNYKAHEWANGGKATSLSLTTNDTLELDVVSEGVILIEGVTSDGDTIPICASDHHIHLKHKFEGFESLYLSATKPMGIRFMHRGAQIGEPMDDRTPPPPKEPTNILQQMRSVIKQELAANRESFLVNDTGLPGYETDDEENFEEEQLAQAQQAQQELIDKSKAKAQPAPAPKPAGKPTDEPKPISADETASSG